MGESAGGGSIMLQDMAYGGTLGTQLFRNSIASSPYLPVSEDCSLSLRKANEYADAIRVQRLATIPSLLRIRS